MSTPPIFRPRLFRAALAEDVGEPIECWYAQGEEWIASTMDNDLLGKKIVVRVNPKLRTIHEHRADAGMVKLPDDRVGEAVVTPNGVIASDGSYV